MYKAETLEKEIAKLLEKKQQLTTDIKEKNFLFSSHQLKSLRAYRTRVNKKLSELTKKFKQYYA